MTDQTTNTYTVYQYMRGSPPSFVNEFSSRHEADAEIESVVRGCNKLGIRGQVVARFDDPEAAGGHPGHVVQFGDGGTNVFRIVVDGDPDDPAENLEAMELRVDLARSWALSRAEMVVNTADADGYGLPLAVTDLAEALNQVKAAEKQVQKIHEKKRYGLHLNAAARAKLAEAGITRDEWTHRHFGSRNWYGDECGCPDDRCTGGYHHDRDEPCGCLDALIEDYLAERDGK